MSDDPTTTPSCCACLNPRPATLRLRVIPRRDRDPLTDAVKRALAWPGQAGVVDVWICGSKACHDRVRAAAVSVLGAEAIDGEAVVRKVEA